MAKHGIFPQYQTIITTENCISTRNLMKIEKYPYIALVMSL